MDPAFLAALAEFLGVEATPDAVREALQQVIGLLDGSTEAAQAGGTVLPEPGALRSALDLDTDAADETVLERLDGMLALLDAPPPDDDEADMAYNYAALRAARRHFDAVADHIPAGGPLPYLTPDDAPFQGDDDDPNGHYDDDPPPARRTRSQRAARSRSIYAPNVNTGRAPKPSVAHAVLAGLGYRPPGYRGSVSAIRARLFQTDRAAKADSADGPRGAWVLNRELAADILDPLTSALVLFEAGAFRMPMDGIDSLTIRKMAGAPGAYWAAEHTEIEGDNAEWSVATLTLKELRAPTTWPNRWLRNLAQGAENMIRDQMVKAMRLKMERSALFGGGAVPADGRSTGAEPLGVRYTPGVTVTAFSPARSPGIADLETAQGALEDADVEETDSWGWLSHPRTFRTFEYMRDENGRPILRDSWADGTRERTLVDYPYHKTTGVPKNLGVGGDESNLFFGDWQELVVGMGMDVELIVSEHYKIGENATFVMAVAYVDTAVMYPEAFHVHTGVMR